MKKNIVLLIAVILAFLLINYLAKRCDKQTEQKALGEVVDSQKKLFIIWASDTPSGATVKSFQQILAKFVFTAWSGKSWKPVTVTSLAIEVWSSFPATEWKLYGSSLSQPPLASGQSLGPFKIVFSDFVYLLAPGASRNFFITANTTQAILYDTIVIRIQSTTDIGADVEIDSKLFPLNYQILAY